MSYMLIVLAPAGIALLSLSTYEVKSALRVINKRPMILPWQNVLHLGCMNMWRGKKHTDA